MDEDAFNRSVRKFLKKLGVSAQREIKLSVQDPIEAGELRGDESSRQQEQSPSRACGTTSS